MKQKKSNEDLELSKEKLKSEIQSIKKLIISKHNESALNSLNTLETVRKVRN